MTVRKSKTVLYFLLISSSQAATHDCLSYSFVSKEASCLRAHSVQANCVAHSLCHVSQQQDCWFALFGLSQVFDSLFSALATIPMQAFSWQWFGLPCSLATGFSSALSIVYCFVSLLILCWRVTSLLCPQFFQRYLHAQFSTLCDVALDDHKDALKSNLFHI